MLLKLWLYNDNGRGKDHLILLSLSLAKEASQTLMSLIVRHEQEKSKWSIAYPVGPQRTLLESLASIARTNDGKVLYAGRNECRDTVYSVWSSSDQMGKDK